jgi:signal transduction histidine kinase/ActR/RegA family two-component response regulator
MMARWWKRTPVVALTIAVALLLAGIVLALYNERSYKAQKIDEVMVQARILASSVTAALSFNDRRAAQEYVNALEANPEVRTVAVYEETGAVFADFSRLDDPLPERPPPPGAAFEGDRLSVVAPVLQGDATLGTVYVQTITEPFARRLERYGVLVLLVTMASLVIGVLGAAHAALSRANAELERRAADLADANRNLETQMAEREKAEAALRRAQRLEAVGQLTAGVAHDFNNLLTAVIGNLDMLASRVGSDERSGRMAAAARRAAERGAQLTAQLLAFSRRQRLVPEPVNINAVVRQMEAMLRSTLGAQIVIETELAEGLPLAMADANQIELMVLNLAINARDAMPGGGSIVIATTAEHLGEPGRPEEPPAGDYVVLTVRDTGTGIPLDVLEQVFEPFFTTKDIGKGSGLGLSQVLGVAQQLGGGVRVETALGAGTAVRICLPRAAASGASGAVEHRDRKPALAAGPRRARILLADDDRDARAVTAEMLDAAGHEVVEADGAAAALAVIGREAGGFDVLVADFAMPGMNGVDLAREIRRHLPGLPVVFITGFADTAALAAYAARDELVEKPFRGADLLEKVARALDRGTGSKIVDRRA